MRKFSVSWFVCLVDGLIQGLQRRYDSLSEVWQRGYSLDYRLYRLCETLGILDEDV